MDKSNLTLGEVLPSDMRSQYPSEVLDVSMEEAINIAKYDMPPSSDLSASDIEDIKSIYSAYMANHDDHSNSAYWNTTPDKNQAYWNTTT
ncbi:MAG: hypothetical protein IPM48_05385 [Saprospiraceae bacterium]|nr:hypothetical protein [Saprospiraceae bacterium]